LRWVKSEEKNWVALSGRSRDGLVCKMAMIHHYRYL
jgi:hypothetical protein